MATASKLLKMDPMSMDQIKFLGPAQQEFNSFAEQGGYFLDNYWPRWNSSGKPQSYVIPPIFYYQLPDINDETYEQAKMALDPQKPDPIVKHRPSDEAEHIVYKAISQLIEDGIQAPFIAIHNLNIDRIKNHLPKFFPLLRWEYLRKALLNCFKDQMIQLFPDDAMKRQSLEVGFQNRLDQLLKDVQWEKFANSLELCLSDLPQKDLPEDQWKKLKKALDQCFQENNVREYDFFRDRSKNWNRCD